MTLVSSSQVFQDFDADENQIIIPYVGLPGLQPTETRDVREVLRTIIEQAFSTINALSDEQKPTGFTITKNNPVGTGLNQVNQTYTITITYQYNTSEVNLIPEPSLEIKTVVAPL